MSSKVSFTVRRPTPSSRGTSSGLDSDADSPQPSFKIPPPPPLVRTSSNAPSPLANAVSVRRRDDDSDEENDEEEKEIISGFDKFGVQRKGESAKNRFKKEGPLVIPALKNRDWRQNARVKKERFIPGAGAVKTGADGSVGGLGTKDSINSGPQMAGLHFSKKNLGVDAVKQEGDGDGDVTMKTEDAQEQDQEEVKKEEPLSEDQLAIRALLASATKEGDDEPSIGAIPLSSNSFRSFPETETDAYRTDVVTRPDSASLDDYERVPVSQFGAALLRGMGWKEGGVDRKGKKIEPWVPAQRPSLLGLGAKERVVDDDGTQQKKKPGKEIKQKYIPVVKQEKSGSSASSRRPSRERSPDRRRERDRSRGRERDGTRDRERDGDRYTSDRDRDRRRQPEERGRDRDYTSDRDDRKRRDDRDRAKSESLRSVGDQTAWTPAGSSSATSLFHRTRYSVLALVRKWSRYAHAMNVVRCALCSVLSQSLGWVVFHGQYSLSLTMPTDYTTVAMNAEPYL
ncbi:hypothetical protein SISSUDRAFT_1113349 [Sistotremastrum suecicum HHB10207 ss-3]|uniref:Spp2/MOS2 G-patch domain-containing protein n=1 Tax=Sistotremastrum suecicum HHB10207 ss-3 TaxID=1314776 RepID=A0A166F7Q0_9AGAM|nr:hypothetical protein SISSUDRAFT_1113349 [Sistotremastrum suecicum HHB10207 ss-3]